MGTGASERPAIRGIAGALAVVLVPVALAASRPDGGFGPDGVAYARQALSLVAGDGLWHPAATPTGWAPFATWPPGYPALLALPVAAGLDPWAAAVVVQVLLSVGLLLLVRRRAPDALPGLLLALGTGGLLRLRAQVASELPMLVALVGLGLALDRWRRQPSEGAWLAVAAGALAAVGFRYLGLVGAIAVGLFALDAIRRGRRRRGLLLGAAALPAFTALAAWMGRNLVLTGHPTGLPRLPAPESHAQLAVSLARALASEGVIPISHLSTTPEGLAALGVGLLGTAWAGWALRGATWPRILDGPAAPWAILAALGGIATVALRWTRHFDLFGWRLLGPWVALALLALGHAAARTGDPRWRTAGTRALVTALLVQGALVAPAGFLRTGGWFVARDALAAAHADLPTGCLVGFADPRLAVVRPDLVVETPRHRPYDPVSESRAAFSDRLLDTPHACVVVEVPEAVGPRFHPSWADAPPGREVLRAAR